MNKLKTVLITGGAGYVGSVLVPKLLNEGYRIKVLDLYIFGEDTLNAVKDNPNLEEIKGDIRDQELLKKILPGCDAVIHLACIANDPCFELNPALSRIINYEAFEPLVKISKENGVKRFIYASTCSVYGLSDAEKVTEDHPLVPITDYNKYKGLCEPILLKYQSSDFTAVVIRPATVCGYSPRQRLDLTVNILANHAYNKNQIKIFGGTQTRPNIHIEDIADLYVMLLKLSDKKIAGKTYNAGYQNRSITDIANIVQRVFKEKLTDRPEPEITTVESKDPRSYRICSDKIKEELNFVPKHTIEDAAADLIKAFQEGKLPNSMDDIRYYNIKNNEGGQFTMRVPYVDIAGQHVPIKDKLLKAVGEVIDSGNFVLGEQVREFEKRFAELCGVKYTVGVNSGTDALIIALRALDIGAGDEVITVSNSFSTTASCIAYVGARPVFVDVRDDCNIDPALIERSRTSKTRAILPVHLTGRPADMKRIIAIAKKHNLSIIEDAAQAVCAEYEGKKAGSFGDVGCFSLHPLKTLNACGDGGVITTDNMKLYEKLKILRENGFRSRDDCVVWSGNSRLDTLQAAMLLVKLDHLDEWTEKRRENARFYQGNLADMSQVQVPVDKPHEKSVYHTFVVQADQRDKLKSFLAEEGVDTKIHYPIPIHLQPAAKELGYKKGSLPETEGQSKRILSLPVYHGLSQENLEYVVQCIHRFYQKKEG